MKKPFKLKIIPLKWDSAFLGLRIAKVYISTMDEADLLICQQDDLRLKYDIIYVFSKSDVLFNASHSFLVDKKVTYKVDLGESPCCNDNIVEYNNNYVSEELKQLAIISGNYSRFKKDPLLPYRSYERLYTCWIEKSVNKEIATEVFCYMIDNLPRGLVTLNRESEGSTIGLVSTHPDFQHQGIGTKMLEYVKNFVYTGGGKTLTVVTQQQNIKACHLYEKVGFLQTDIANVWHWWLNCSTK